MGPSESEIVASMRHALGHRIRRTRQSQDISQSELAERAGVDLASVYRAERGIAVRIGTLKKIAVGLNTILGDLLLEKAEAGPVNTVAVHRANLAQWFPGIDKRPRVPQNVGEECREVGERRRLGRIGFVPWFMCPPLIIPERGPGIVLLEVCDELVGPFNQFFYEDGALYVIDGAVTVTASGEPTTLHPHDWIAFKTAQLEVIRKVPPHECATLLWIGANRPKRRR